MRHGYKSDRRLGITYEKRQDVWHILWYCIKTGNVIQDQPLKRSERNDDEHET
jgi:hypothetical protein